MDLSQILSITIFVICMITIMTEKIHRSTVAICGAMLCVIFGLVNFVTPNQLGDAQNGDVVISEIVDFNTLGVLFGMMLFVYVVKQSGLFEYLAIKGAILSKGHPWKIMVVFIFLTAILSAFLDNVTTVLLIGPVTLTICKYLKLNPIPYFITQILASNIGGTATLIGDPPNIMIGSTANLSFIDFIKIDGPIILIILFVSILCFKFIYAKNLKVKKEDQLKIMNMNPNEQIKNTYLLKLSIVMMIILIICFMFHSNLGLKTSYIAIAGAGLILLLSGCNIEDALLDIEWTTLVFFFGLFVIVGSLKVTGVIDILANALVNITSNNTFALMIILLIGSALISSILDNIPFVATMLPIITAMQGTIDVVPLWWALSLGACLGGNGTLIGASANVVLCDVSNKNGYPISFMEFTKIGFPIMLMTVAISCAYMILRYYTIGF